MSLEHETCRGHKSRPYFSGAAFPSSPLPVFEMRFLTDLKLNVRLDQLAMHLGICLSRPLQRRGYKNMLPCPAAFFFYVGSRDQPQFLVLAKKSHY